MPLKHDDSPSDRHSRHDTATWFEISAVVATAALHLLLRTRGATALFIALASVFWAVYIALHVRQDATAWTRWGFRTDNLRSAFKGPTVLFILASSAMGTYGVIAGTLVWHWHLLLLLLLYPLWGILQQFLVQALVVANLAKMSPRHGRTLAIPIGAVLFGAIHYPSPLLMLATSGLGCFFILWYLRYRNLWPLGLYHGWLGTFFYLWVLGRDPWFDVFGRWLPSAT
ncbi:MAG: CPBP family intramembrane metalloprotease [Candidatus Krumholzibacteria bacterium]|nr:CPBP family intramembrane metalloprotease [Candidatus Krumholzibacteria bacterium]